MNNKPDTNTNQLFTIKHLYNEYDKDINIEELFNLPGWTKYLYYNYCNINDNANINTNNSNIPNNTYLKQNQYTLNDKNIYTTILLNILWNPKFKELYKEFWLFSKNNIHKYKKYKKGFKTFVSRFHILLTDYITILYKPFINGNGNNTEDTTIDNTIAKLEVYISMLLNYLDTDIFYDNIRLFILKLIEFDKLYVKYRHTHKDNIKHIEYIDKTHNKMLYNIIKCYITCYSFQTIITNTIPTITINHNTDILFFISACYSIVDDAIDTNTDKLYIYTILKYIGEHLDNIQQLLFTSCITRKSLIQHLTNRSNTLLINSKNSTSLSIIQINYILHILISFFLNILTVSTNKTYNDTLKTLKIYINIIQYNFKLELHCYKLQTNSAYCNNFNNISGLTICKGLSMGYLSCLQNNIDNFTSIISLTHNWCNIKHSVTGVFTYINDIGIFQLFSILIQLIDDIGDYQQDSLNNIYTSIQISGFTNNANTQTNINNINNINNEIKLSQFISSTHKILFNYAYNLIKTNRNCRYGILLSSSYNNISIHNIHNTDNTYLNIIINWIYQFFYYSITKNDKPPQLTYLLNMNLDKYYMFDNKSILKIRNMKNATINHLRQIII
jgi:hypothetical protein